MEKSFNPTSAYIRDVIMSRPSFGESGSVPIDQTPSQEFNVDPCTGRPMNDIQRLVKSQSDLEMQAQFAQLKEFKANFLPKDMSDSDALKFMCPRTCQLPSEILDYRVNHAKDALNQEIQKRNAAKLEDSRKKTDELLEKMLNKKVDES